MSMADGVIISHYRPDGDLYDQMPRVIHTLEPTYLRSAYLVASVVCNADKRGELDGDQAELLTNREIRRRVEAETGRRYSLSFIKKGLFALHRVLGEKGLALIDRIRQHGRRVISLVRGIREKGKDKMPGPGEPILPPAAPLCTPPPEKRGGEETTTTRDPSSSSLASLPGGGPGPPTAEAELPPELVNAIGLVPDLSREKLEGWVRRFGLELTRRAVAWLRIWLCHPRPEKRPQVAFWAEKALVSWKAQLERGELALADVDHEIEAKRRKWSPKVAPRPSMAAAGAPSKEEPAQRLTAEQVALLLETSRSRSSSGAAGMARKTLLESYEAGLIDDDQVPNIPPELLRRE
jgi:hypothetical protein